MSFFLQKCKIKISQKIKSLQAPGRHDTQHNNTQLNATLLTFFVPMLSVIILSVILFNASLKCGYFVSLMTADPDAFVIIIIITIVIWRPCSNNVEWQFVSSFVGATTFSKTTLNIMTFSINGFYVTPSINNTQHTWLSAQVTLSAIKLSVVKLSVAFHVLLLWMSLCWMSLCWMSWCRFVILSLCNKTWYLMSLGRLS